MSRTAASPSIAASPTGMIDVPLGRICAIFARRSPWISRSCRSRGLRRDPRRGRRPQHLSILGRDRVGGVVRLDRGTGRGDAAIDVGAAFLADLGQVWPHLAPLPPERVALRAPGLLAREKRLASRSVAAGEVRQDQRCCRPRPRAARVPRAGSRVRVPASVPSRSCPWPVGRKP